MQPTHIVETTYQHLAPDRSVIKDWTIKTKCGREFPEAGSRLAERGSPVCKTCEKSWRAWRKREGLPDIPWHRPEVH